MTEEIIQESNQIGFLDLIKNMLSARTLPHIVMIGIVSFLLLLLVDTQENFVSFAFIALSISYAIIAAISNNNTMQKLITLPEDKTGSKLFIRLMMSLGLQLFRFYLLV